MAPRASSTAKVYDGYARRYEKWCTEASRDPTDVASLDDYVAESRALSGPYLRNVERVLLRKWFCYDARGRGPGGRVPPSRTDRVFTPEQVGVLRASCLGSYESDELSLWVLLLIDTPLRPRDLPRLNDPDYRKGRVGGYLGRFLDGVSGGPVFPRRRNTYLARFKKRVSRVLKTVEGGTFEMLLRSVKRMRSGPSVEHTGYPGNSCTDSEEGQRTSLDTINRKAWVETPPPSPRGEETQKDTVREIKNT